MIATLGLLLVIFSLARTRRGDLAPASVPAFVAFQLLGGGVAIVLIRALYPDITPEEASEIMLPQSAASPAAAKPR